MLRLLVLLLTLTGCDRRPTVESAAPPAREPAVVAQPAPQPPPQPPPPPAPPAKPRAAHPELPPIDCPLRKAGVDASKLRPFEDVDRYITFLERPDRALWQKPDEVVAALGLKGTEVVADVGAGSGYFSFRLGRALPRGRVVALDIEPEMVRHVHHRAQERGVANVTAELTRPEEPEVPRETDLVFVCDVLHHVTDRPAWLAALAGRLRPRARLVVIEFKEGDLPAGPPAAAKLPRAELQRLIEAAGFRSTGERPGLLPYQVFLEFVRA